MPGCRWYVVLVALCGCAAQSENYDDKDWTVDHGAEEGAWREAESLFGESEAKVDNFNYEPRSVRHDLTMQPQAPADARCGCIDVVAGQPGQTKFTWAGDRPPISPNDMVIALRPQSCQGAAAGRRPSIKAVDKRGNDVVVVVEELVVDRPQQLGAIIPRPVSAGELYVAPAAAGPYGRGSQGGACRVPLAQRDKSSAPKR
jgi:hypothetical protein